MNKNLCAIFAATVIVSSIVGISYCLKVVFDSDAMCK